MYWKGKINFRQLKQTLTSFSSIPQSTKHSEAKSGFWYITVEIESLL
jgi:hypothetical protein